VWQGLITDWPSHNLQTGRCLHWPTAPEERKAIFDRTVRCTVISKLTQQSGEHSRTGTQPYWNTDCGALHFQTVHRAIQMWEWPTGCILFFSFISFNYTIRYYAIYYTIYYILYYILYYVLYYILYIILCFRLYNILYTILYIIVYTILYIILCIRLYTI
jgi:hypothetical protein